MRSIILQLALSAGVAMAQFPVPGGGTGGGGGGVGAANVTATSAPAVTSLAIDISSLGLASTNTLLVQCWSGTAAPYAPVTITSLNPASTSSVTANFTSTANVTCRANSNGGAGAAGAIGATGAAGPSGLLSGTLAAIPATCTTGVSLYQATDQPITTQIYSCTATNTWTRASYTQGTSTPGTCAVGEFFFDTDATAGQNIYGCTATNTWTLEAGGGGGGATSASALLDLAVVRTSGTVLTIGTNCSASTPCNVRVGSTVYSFTAAATATITAGTGTAYVYVTPAGALTVGHNLTVTCSGCTSTGGVTSFPAESAPLWTWTATATVWDVSGGADKRAFLGMDRQISSATLNVATTPAGTTINYNPIIPVEVTITEAGTATATGDGKFYLPIPSEWNGYELVSVSAHVTSVGTTNTTTVQLARCAVVATGNQCSGTVVDMLSTLLTIDSNENKSSTAATAAVINTANDDLSTDQVIRFDVDAISTTPAQGLTVIIGVRKP